MMCIKVYVGSLAIEDYMPGILVSKTCYTGVYGRNDR